MSDDAQSPSPSTPTTSVFDGYPDVLTRENWPITVPMMPHPHVLADGTTVQDQPAEGWAATLEVMVDAGYTSIDPPTPGSGSPTCRRSGCRSSPAPCAPRA